MFAKLEISDEELKRRLERIVLRKGFLLNNSADLVFSDDPRVVAERLVLVSKRVPEPLPDNVVDVIDPDLPDQLLERRIEMLKLYVLFPAGILSFLEEEFEKSKRYGIPLSVVHLHLEDSRYARIVAAELSRMLRSTDKFDLLNDTEILIVLPGTSKEGAERFFKRLRRKLLRLDWTRQPLYDHAIVQVEPWMESTEDLLLFLRSR